MIDLIGQIKQWGSAVLVTGDSIDPLARISDRMAVLEQGVKIAEGSPAEMKRHRRVIEITTGVPS